jgi:hypothetical protein
LSVSLSERFAIELAYGYDEGQACIGAAFLDYHFPSSEGSEHPVRGFRVDHSGIMFGQFDIPFGIDYLVLPSPDRLLITTPLAVSMLHDSWNDIGIQYYVDCCIFNLAAYLVNGSIWENNAFGTRIGIRPTENLELGVSYALNLEVTEQSLIGVDFSVQLASLNVRGEYILRNIEEDEVSIKSSGFYAEGSYMFDKLFLVGRYSSYVADEDADAEDQLSLGGGYFIEENVQFRLQYEMLEEDAVIFQTVFGF